MGVELAAPVPFVGAFDGGDAGLGEPLAQGPFQELRRLFLGQAPQFAGGFEVVGDDLVQVRFTGAAVGGERELVARLRPSASDHVHSIPLLPGCVDITARRLADV